MPSHKFLFGIAIHPSNRITQLHTRYICCGWLAVPTVVLLLWCACCCLLMCRAFLHRQSFHWSCADGGLLKCLWSICDGKEPRSPVQSRFSGFVEDDDFRRMSHTGSIVTILSIWSFQAFTRHSLTPVRCLIPFDERKFVILHVAIKCYCFEAYGTV